MGTFNEKGFIHQVLSSLDIMIYSKDEQGNFRYASESCEYITGFQPDSFQEDPSLWMSRVHPEDTETYHRKLEMLNTHGSITAEYRFTCQDGTVKWFLDKIYTVTSSSRKMAGTSGIIQDISTYRQEKRELQLIRAAINSAPNGIIIVDVSQKSMPIIFVNRAFESLTGYTVDEVVGKNCHFLQQEDRQQKGIEEIRSAIRRRKNISVVLRNYKKNGKLFYNHISIAPINDSLGKTPYFIGIQSDVTEKMQLQKKLQAHYEKEKYLRDMTEIIADLNILIGAARNESHLIRTVCHKLIDINHYRYAWISVIENDRIKKEYALGEKNLTSAQKKKYMEIIHVKMENPLSVKEISRDTHRILGHSITIPVFTQSKPAKMLGHLVLFSNQDKGFLEEEISILRELVFTISSAIEYQKLDQLMFYHARQTAMGELIELMAHQWRQPINELGLILQDLRDAHACHELDNQYLIKNTKDGMELLQRMSSTIDEFRHFFISGPQKKSFKIAEVIHQTISLMGPFFSKLAIDIEILEEESVIITGHSHEFAQVVFNLLNNSRDALLRHKPLHPKIRISITQSAGCAEITIEDNGGGVPESALDQIFDQYYSTKNDQQGAGLGLYISKMIIENSMSGRLIVKNTIQGVRFIVEVPV